MTLAWRWLPALIVLAGCPTTAERVTVPRDAGAVVDATSTDRPVAVDAPVTPADRPSADVPVDRGAPVDTGPAVLGPDTVIFTGSLPNTAGRSTARLTVGGRERQMLVYLPATRSASPPLLVLFHGTNDSADAVFSESAAQRVADANGVVVIAPQAVDQTVSDWDHPDSEGVWWQTYPSVSPDTNPDTLLVRAILVAAQRVYSVDPTRIYLLGHSNGAFFAQLLANTIGERIAAWASSSGGLCNCATRPDCTFVGRGTTCAALASQSGWCACTGPDKPGPIRTSGRRPPAYLTHGSNDDIVSAHFTCNLASRLAAAGFEVETVIRDNEQHVMPDDFAVTVWPWLFRHRRD